MKNKGITFEEFACLGRCNGLQIESHYADRATKDIFMAALKDACASTDRVLVVSYSRKALRQTGDGHFSPVGGYDATSNMVLILDVARFKVQRQTAARRESVAGGGTLPAPRRARMLTSGDDDPACDASRAHPG